jgi:hypothetical protein
MTTNQGKITMKLIAEFADGKRADVGTVEVDVVAGVTEDELFATARRAVEHGLAPTASAASDAVAPADEIDVHRREVAATVLRDFAAFIDRGPTFDMSPSLFSTMAREYAEDYEQNRRGVRRSAKSGRLQAAFDPEAVADREAEVDGAR